VCDEYDLFCSCPAGLWGEYCFAFDDVDGYVFCSGCGEAELVVVGVAEVVCEMDLVLGSRLPGLWWYPDACEFLRSECCEEECDGKCCANKDCEDGHLALFLFRYAVDCVRARAKVCGVVERVLVLSYVRYRYFSPGVFLEFANLEVVLEDAVSFEPSFANLEIA